MSVTLSAPGLGFWSLGGAVFWVVAMMGIGVGSAVVVVVVVVWWS